MSVRYSPAPWTKGPPVLRHMEATITVPGTMKGSFLDVCHVDQLDGFAGFEEGTSEANANLITAAPDLLEALIAVMGDQVTEDMILKARVAINKALGK